MAVWGHLTVDNFAKFVLVIQSLKCFNLLKMKKKYLKLGKDKAKMSNGIIFFINFCF